MEVLVSEPVPECPRCRELEARIHELETKLRDLEVQLKPPPKRPLDPTPPATGKKRGAQPGHKPHLKKWLPRSRVTTFVPYIPKCCAQCDQALSATAGPLDPMPTIHQVAELPKILAEITQHEGHSRTCSCGHVNHTTVPAEVRAHSIGPNLTAAIVYLGGSHGMSKRGIEETVECLLGVPIALGTIANLEQAYQLEGRTDQQSRRSGATPRRALAKKIVRLPKPGGVPLRRTDPDCGANSAVEGPKHAGVPRTNHRRPPAGTDHANAMPHRMNGYKYSSPSRPGTRPVCVTNFSERLDAQS